MSCVNIWIHFSFESIDAPEGTAARKRPLSVAKSTWDRHGKRRHLVLHPGVVNLCDFCRFCEFFPNFWWCLCFCCGLNGGIAPGIQNFSGFQCANEGHGPTRHHRARQKQKNVEGPAQVTKLFELRKWLSQEMLPAKTCKVTANKKEVHYF